LKKGKMTMFDKLKRKLGWLPIDERGIIKATKEINN
jgi:hypothetical protein